MFSGMSDEVKEAMNKKNADKRMIAAKNEEKYIRGIERT